MTNALSGPQLVVRDPSDARRIVGEAPTATADDSIRALDRATAVQPVWARTDRTQRGKILLRLADLIRRDAASLAELISGEMGKLLGEAAGEAESAAAFADYYGGLGSQAYGEVLPSGRPNASAYAVREPVGVVLLVTPWNDPLVTPLRKLAPALLCGNPVLLKPSSETPLVALKLAELLVEAGLPENTLQVLPGPASAVVTPLIDDDRVAAVSFTGSTEVGLGLRRRLADRNCRLLTEMGGKNSAIVFDDADLDTAIPHLMTAAYGQAGQRCTATSRLLVQEGIRAEFLERFAHAVESIRLGAPSDSATTMGPVISSGSREQVLAAIAASRESGSSVIGGTVPEQSELSHGWFVRPSLILDAPIAGPAWTDELFAPVVACRSFSTPDEAIQSANGTRYGLSTAAFTNDLGLSQRLTRELATGQVAVNLPTSGWPAFLPFGGWGDSGSAHKEQGTQVLDFYSRWKTVAVASN